MNRPKKKRTAQNEIKMREQNNNIYPCVTVNQSHNGNMNCDFVGAVTVAIVI